MGHRSGSRLVDPGMVVVVVVVLGRVVVVLAALALAQDQSCKSSGR